MIPKEGDHFARRYRIVRVIGRGAMGIVMEAVHETLDTRVAIKILRPETKDERATRRFLREAKLASSLRSESVVKVLDVDRTEDDTPYIVMELLDGRDLAAEIQERDAVPYTEAIRWMLGVCDAMKEAHAAGIVHRDLKLSNAFLCVDGRIKVLDFGVAALGSSDTDSSTIATVAGTIRYMAPEQLLGEAPDPRSDVWAVGVMLYRLVSGRFPYETPTAAAQMLAIMDGCPPIASLAPDIPERLARITQAALGRTLEERCPSIDVLATELRAVLNDGAAPASRGPLRETTTVPTRKVAPTRWLVGLAVFVLALGGLGTALQRHPEAPRKPDVAPVLTTPAVVTAASSPIVESVPPPAITPKPLPSSAPMPRSSTGHPARPRDDGFPSHL